MGMNVLDATRTPVGYQQNTDQDPAVGLTVPENARVAIIQAEAADIRWRDDGTDPTASVGMLLASGESFLYTGELTKIKFFETGTGSILNVSYYK